MPMYMYLFSWKNKKNRKLISFNKMVFGACNSIFIARILQKTRTQRKKKNIYIYIFIYNERERGRGEREVL
jgi:hypothetical protein